MRINDFHNILELVKQDILHSEAEYLKMRSRIVVSLSAVRAGCAGEHPHHQQSAGATCPTGRQDFYQSGLIEIGRASCRERV